MPSPVISARFAPLPPRRDFMEAFPSEKSYTYFVGLITKTPFEHRVATHSCQSPQDQLF